MLSGQTLRDAVRERKNREQKETRYRQEAEHNRVSENGTRIPEYTDYPALRVSPFEQLAQYRVKLNAALKKLEEAKDANGKSLAKLLAEVGVPISSSLMVGDIRVTHSKGQCRKTINPVKLMAAGVSAKTIADCTDEDNGKPFATVTDTSVPRKTKGEVA